MTPRYPDLKHSVIICVVFLAFQIYISLFASVLTGSKGLIILMSVVVPPLVILGIASHKNGTTLGETLSWGRVNGRTVIPVALMTISLAFVISEVENLVIHYLIPADLYRDYLKQFMEIFFFERPADLVLGLLSIGMVGPFMEEAVFRGIVYRGIASHRGAAYGIAASSVLFMAVHINPLQFPGALILGLIYSTMISRGYRISDTVVAHSLHNSISLLFLFEVIKLPGMNLTPGGAVGHVSIWIVTAGVAVFITAFSLIIRWAPAGQTGEENRDRPEPGTPGGQQPG